MGAGSASPFFRFLKLEELLDLALSDLPIELEFGSWGCDGSDLMFGSGGGEGSLCSIRGGELGGCEEGGDTVSISSDGERWRVAP